MSSRTVVIFSASIALIAGGLYYGVRERAGGAGARGPASLAERVAPAASRAQSPGARAFRFTRDIHAAMGDRPLAELHLRGRLWTRLSSDGALTGLVKVDTIESPQGAKKELPWVRVEMRKAGTQGPVIRVSSAETNAETRSASARFARDLLDQYRFFSKKDLQGGYSAEFTRVDATHFAKTKRKYLEAPYSAAKILDSRHALALAGDGEPARIEGREQIALGEDRLAVRTDSRYAIEADGALGDAFADTRAIAWSDEVMDQPLAPRHARRGMPNGDLALKGVRPLADLLARLKSGALRSGSERLAWFRETVKRINAEAPGRIEPLRSAMPETRSHPEQFVLLVGAMASAGAPDAAQALVEAYRDEAYPPREHAMIMSAWTATDVPLSKDTTDFLVSLASDAGTSQEEGESAMLALGAQALKSGDPSTSATIEALLISKLQQATTLAETVGALDAMGNTGAIDFLPYIQAYLASSSEHVRAHAYLALRFIPGNGVLALITGGSSDPSGEVQNSVKLSLDLRDSSS